MKLPKYMNYKNFTIFVIIIGIIFRIFLSFNHTISGDACWHFSAAKFISEENNFPLYEEIGRDEPFWPPPLFHIVASFFYGLMGFSGMKLVPVIFGSLALIFSYLVFKMVLSDRASFFAVIFMAFLPLSIDYSVLGYADSVLPFFTVLSIYFGLRNQFLLSGIVAGLAILSKYTGIFIIPVLIYLVYKNSDKKDLIKNLSYVVILPGIVSLPWFIRNWILLGNPVWPFLDFIFDGFSGSPRGTYSGLSLVNLSSIATYVMIYLGFFGVPDGAYWLLFFYNIPYIWLLISVFIAGTIIFIIPLFFGFENKKSHRPFHILLLSFLVVFLFFELNVRPAVTRILLPSLIGLAFIYGVGFESILLKKPKVGKFLMGLIILVVVGFVFSEVVKFSLASKSWDSYNEDFEWVKANTNHEDVFLLGSQCLPLRIDRKAVFPSTSISSDKYGYIWINQNFKLEPQSILNEEHFIIVEDMDLDLVYENPKTGTRILKK